MIRRPKTKTIKVGGVKIGGTHPVSIQSMTKTDTRDEKATMRQIKNLEKSGCDIVRVAIKDETAARTLKAIKRKARIPVVADIHFDYRLALACIKNGADKIRINPGNISGKTQLKTIIKAAKKQKIPIRIGINSGSIFRRGQPGAPSSLFVKTALKYIKLFEREDFRDIIISLKSSDVCDTVRAYKKLRPLCDYPFHVGVTAAGPYESSIVKSSIGIGSLLLDGIGDTIRVSLTGDPVREVCVAKSILQALGIRRFTHEIISCPTCGRCQTDLIKIVNRLQSDLNAGRHKADHGRSLAIAIMGCEVNGPGEARQADVGVAAGRGAGLLFKKGKVIKRIKEKDFVKEILKAIN